MPPFVRLPGATLCVVVGQPISHSKSPLIHRLFADQLGIPLQYQRLEIAPGTLAAALAQLHAEGCRGVNVTVPLKEEAALLADTRTEGVALAGAANTLWWTGDEISAANTDGEGLLNDLIRNLKLDLRGRRILLLGAGGAAAGVIGPLLAVHPVALWVMNRNVARAEALVARFRGLGPVSVVSPRDAPPGPPDLVINATAAGLSQTSPEFPGTAVTTGSYCYDMFYAAEPTPFMRRCAELGARGTSDGIGMLVEQAAVAFELWHRRTPDTAPVLAALRARQR